MQKAVESCVQIKGSMLNCEAFIGGTADSTCTDRTDPAKLARCDGSVQAVAKNLITMKEITVRPGDGIYVESDISGTALYIYIMCKNEYGTDDPSAYSGSHTHERYTKRGVLDANGPINWILWDAFSECDEAGFVKQLSFMPAHLWPYS